MLAGEGGTGGDERGGCALEDAPAAVVRQTDGRSLLENTNSGSVHFTLEDGDGRPSRWITPRALRMIEWYEM